MKVHCESRKGEIVKTFGPVIQTEFSQCFNKTALQAIINLPNAFILTQFYLSRIILLKHIS